MRRKVNEFGELVCVCGDEVWDHSMGEEECTVCDCVRYRQAYE
jgi:hypothetical protein